jgi:hypothetical protein
MMVVVVEVVVEVIMVVDVTEVVVVEVVFKVVVVEIEVLVVVEVVIGVEVVVVVSPSVVVVVLTVPIPHTKKSFILSILSLDVLAIARTLSSVPLGQSLTLFNATSFIPVREEGMSTLPV